MVDRYRVEESFEYNKKNGPFEEVEDNNPQINSLLEEYGIEADFFGYKTKLPLGVAAGPLYNIRYMESAAKDGFSVITWKTFRTEDRLAHRNTGEYVGHNIIFIESERFKKEDIGKQIKGSINPIVEKEKVSITNSFGMPSGSPSVWMAEIEHIEEVFSKINKQSITSVVGSPKDGDTIEDLGRDFGVAARLAEIAGARIVEINLSCPNVKGKEGSLFKNYEDAKIITKTTREHLRNKETKLLIKVGYCSVEEYESLLGKVGEFINGVVAINTIPMKVTDEKGSQALPGGEQSGICGYAILDMAVEAVENLVEARKNLNLKFKIFGCGGVTNPESVMKHLDAGAEFVFVGTAALFNPELPLQFAKYINENKIKRKIE